MIDDSIMRLEALQAAVATSPDFESFEDLMARVKIVYAFLAHINQGASYEGTTPIN
jgi:hypothetical protein